MSTTEEKIKELTKRIFGEDADISIKVVTAKMPEDKYKDEKEPNVFVTPSLGGILLKMATEILKDANENGKKVEGEPKDGNEDEPKEKETPIEKESNEVYTPVLTIDLADEDERVEFGVKPDTLIVRTTSDVGNRRLRRVVTVEGLTDPSQVTYMIDRINLTAKFYVDLIDDDVDFIDCDEYDNDYDYSPDDRDVDV